MSATLPLKVGEVYIPEDSDFKHFKSICEDTEGWKLEVNKNQTGVWTKTNDLSDFQMVKVIHISVLLVYSKFIQGRDPHSDHP